MKLTIGENIRNFRKKNDLTQEAFADRLGVTYQSVSRWENGATYPDLELIPAIATALGVTVDELLGIPQMEKEKRAEETFDELRRECLKEHYDTDKIVALLRDIRRNYLDSNLAWRPWCDGNGNVYRDPKILPEVRLLAEAYLEKAPMSPHVIQTMAVAEDEEHIDEFLSKNSTSFNCSERSLRFLRHLSRWECEKFEVERQYRLFEAFSIALAPRCYNPLMENKERQAEADAFIYKLLTLIRESAVDERPDIWVDYRLRTGMAQALHFVKENLLKEAISKIASVVELLEATMATAHGTTLPTSSRFLDGMIWKVQEDWHTPDNNPDSLKEREICVYSQLGNMSVCNCIYPSKYWNDLIGDDFAHLHGDPEFEALCERVKALIVTRYERCL